MFIPPSIFCMRQWIRTSLAQNTSILVLICWTTGARQQEAKLWEENDAWPWIWIYLKLVETIFLLKKGRLPGCSPWFMCSLQVRWVDTNRPWFVSKDFGSFAPRCWVCRSYSGCSFVPVWSFVCSLQCSWSTPSVNKCPNDTKVLQGKKFGEHCGYVYIYIHYIYFPLNNLEYTF